MASVRPVLLVGSIPCADNAAAFKLLGSELGTLASRYPDGETGNRINWVRWQQHVFDDNPDMELVAKKSLEGFKDTIARPFYALRAGADLGKFKFKKLGYAQEAIQSYRIFVELKKAGTIPIEVKFQVALPSVVSLLTVFVEKTDRTKVESALEAAMKADIDEMSASIPLDDLAIQWDVCHELIGFDGGIELHYPDILEGTAARTARLVDLVPLGAEVGIHLCYGDPGHKHVIEPRDTGSSVRFANAICAEAKRRVDWMHIPIPRG